MSLHRVLDRNTAAWLVAGGMIGSGIFFFPGIIADRLPGAGLPIAAWILGGLIALCGAMTYGELGARIPHAGGDYRYLNEAYGPFWGFLNGWAAMTLTFSAAAAAQAQSSLAYLERLWPQIASVPFLPAVIILALTATNVVGAKASGRATLLLTALPIAALFVLFAVGLGDAELSSPGSASELPASQWPVAIALALVPIYFAYSGWNAAAYLAGEMKAPKKELGPALVLGTFAVIALYTAVNGIVLASVPAEELRGSTSAVAQAALRLSGPSAERWIAAIVAVAILGSCNVTLMAGARIYYAMAKAGQLPKLLSRTNAAGVPSTALWIGGAWACVLSLFNEMEQLVEWATLAILLLSSFAVSSLFVLRARNVGDPDGYRVPAYPLVPALYLVISLAVAVAVLRNDPVHAGIGLAIILVGALIYPALSRQR